MSLDLKRKEVELMRVQCARQELELKIEERLDEVKRLTEHVEIQKVTEIKLREDLNNLKGKG